MDNKRLQKSVDTYRHEQFGTDPIHMPHSNRTALDPELKNIQIKTDLTEPSQQ